MNQLANFGSFLSLEMCNLVLRIIAELQLKIVTEFAQTKQSQKMDLLLEKL